MEFPYNFNGYRVIEERRLTEEVTQTWKERLFSWPWRPFKKTRTVPSATAVMWGNTLILHPVMANKLVAMRVTV